MKSYTGTVQNGTVVLPPDCDLHDGQRVRVEEIEEPDTTASSRETTLPLDEHHPACGMWADRPEMADSVAYVRDLRERLGRRDE